MTARKIITLLALMTAPMVCAVAHAAEEGFYVGASGGQTNVDQNADEFGYPGPFNVKIRDDDTGWKAYLGYNFFPWLGVEAGYVDFGGVSRSVFDQDIKVDFSGWDGFAVGRLPVGPVDVFVKAGVIDLRTELDVNTAGSSNENDTQLAYGAGIAYNYGNWSVRAEAEGFDDNTIDDFYFLSAGITYTFASKPAPVAAPVAAAAPAQCPDADADGVCDAEDECLDTAAGTSVDSMGCNCNYSMALEFAFDSARLSPRDMALLDEIVPVLKNPKVNFISGEINGHTDSIGTEQYNLGLSKRRAEAVAAYLQQQGVDLGDRFTINGFGKAYPIASNDTEAGRAQNRRVEIRRTDCGT
jgi:outer membrane protein OmpA-like peptidoglycan-associated protein